MKPDFPTPAPEFLLLGNPASDFEVQTQGAGHKGMSRVEELKTRPAWIFQLFKLQL